MYLKETNEVITIAPNGRVITFKDYLTAKVTLNKEHHGEIVKDVQDLCARYSMGELKRMLRHTLDIESSIKEMRRVEDLTNKVEVAETLWPMLVAQGYHTIREAFGLNPVHKLATHVIYYSEWVPGTNQLRDLSYIKLANQARVLADMIAEHITPRKEGVPYYKVVRLLNEWHQTGKLVTKQDPLFIWSYYKSLLSARGFLIEVKPKSQQRS